MNPRYRLLQLFFSFLVLLTASTANAEWYSRVDAKMGTRIEVQLWAEDPEAAAKLLDASMAEVDRIEQLMSTYIDTSEMSRINANAADTPQEVSPELFLMLEQALEMSAITDGAFDITFDSVGQLYDFREKRRPTEAELGVLLPTVNYELIELDNESQSIFFARPGVRIRRDISVDLADCLRDEPEFVLRDIARQLTLGALFDTRGS